MLQGYNWDGKYIIRRENGMKVISFKVFQGRNIYSNKEVYKT